MTSSADPGCTLDPLEVHCGFVLGHRQSPLPSEPPGIPGTPREVLDELLVNVLAEPPCHVLFSGGRDSAVMLAAATAAARAQGLPDPVPLTARFAKHPRSWETDWQERVVAHLDLQDWERVEIDDELDALGEIATGALARHGLYWPSNAHFMLLFAGRVDGGTFLTGGGGDELFSPWGWRRPSLAQLRNLRPRRRVAKWAPYAALPLRGRQYVGTRGGAQASLPWLRPEAAHRLDALTRVPPARSWAVEVRRYLDSRYLECLHRTLGLLTAGVGVRLVEPFYHRRFVAAVARSAPAQGYADRGDALAGMFGDLLPREVLYRSTKATFTEALWGPRARAFIESWDGSGLDETLVDPDLVAAEWAAPVPDGRTATMLHLAYLAGVGGR